MRFIWDEAKNRANQKEHEGISFEAAAKVFDDPNFVLVRDRIDQHTGEQRWHAIGVPGSQAFAVLLVVHVYRSDENGEEIIRILSARRAEKHEVRRYFQ